MNSFQSLKNLENFQNENTFMQQSHSYDQLEDFIQNGLGGRALESIPRNDILDAMLRYKGLIRSEVDYETLLSQVPEMGFVEDTLRLRSGYRPDIDSRIPRLQYLFSQISPPIIAKLDNVVSHALKNYYDSSVLRDMETSLQPSYQEVSIKENVDNIEQNINNILNLLGTPYEISGGLEYSERQRRSKLSQLGVSLRGLTIKDAHSVNNTAFSVKFRDKRNEKVIEWEHLSMGERAILSLVSILFERHNTDNSLLIAKPLVLLLDEPDAHLHPAAVSKLLTVLREVVIGEMGIKVVLTTHSPVTLIASGVEECLVMENGEAKLVTLKQAQRRLMEGISNISLVDTSTVYVFTESQNDADVYKEIYSILTKDISFPDSLIFLPSGSGDGGNCNLVKHIVGSVGLPAKYKGVIDWDARNEPQDGVFVLAYGERYTIENCIFDPLVISAFLISRNKSFPEGVIKPHNTSTRDFIGDKNLSQRIANEMVSFVLGDLDDPKCVESKYYGGFALQLRSDYLGTPGHDLESMIRQKIVSLNITNLKKEVCVFLRDFPEVIPTVFVDLMHDLLKTPETV